ncbi:hypothetical protein EAG_12745, partial [Camponotus floridanus]
LQQELNRMFANKWIGSPVLFPAKSSDLTCLDFYLWGRVKELIYFQRPTTRENMIERIKIIFREITTQELEEVQASFPRRLQACLAQSGTHFEHLL